MKVTVYFKDGKTEVFDDAHTIVYDHQICITTKEDGTFGYPKFAIKEIRYTHDEPLETE